MSRFNPRYDYARPRAEAKPHTPNDLWSLTLQLAAALGLDLDRRALLSIHLPPWTLWLNAVSTPGECGWFKTPAGETVYNGDVVILLDDRQVGAYSRTWGGVGRYQCYVRPPEGVTDQTLEDALRAAIARLGGEACSASAPG